MMKKLNGAEREFAALNHPLAYYFLKKKGLPREMYGVIIFGYLKAVRAYLSDNHGYAFSTIAFRCMARELQAHYAYNKAMKRNMKTVSLDEIRNKGRESLSSAQPGRESGLLEALAQVKLAPAQKLLIKLLYLGYTQKQAATALGLPYKKVQRELMGLRAAIRREYKERKFFNVAIEKQKLESIKIGEPFIFNGNGKLVKTRPVISLSKKRGTVLIETMGSIYEFKKS